MNFTNNTLSRQLKPDSSRTGELVAWCFGYIVVGALAILGNSVTIAVFVKRNFQRKKLHYLLINLAVTDLIVGTISVPIQIAIIADDIQKTKLDTSVYRAHFFFDVLSGLASMYSIAFIAIERFIAVTWPLKHRMLKPWHYAMAISLTWLIAIIPAIASHDILRHHVGPLEALNVRTPFAVLAILITITAYCLLLLIRKKRECGNRLSRYNRSIVFTLLIVTIVFVCTWSPFILLTSIGGYVSLSCSLTMNRFILAADITKLLQYSNSCVNPFIYAFRIRTFRASAWDLLFCGKMPRPKFSGSSQEMPVTFAGSSTEKRTGSEMTVDIKLGDESTRSQKDVQDQKV